MHAVIEDLARDRAVVTIAHRLSTVIDADVILVMEDGRVRARGTHPSSSRPTSSTASSSPPSASPPRRPRTALTRVPR